MSDQVEELARRIVAGEHVSMIGGRSVGRAALAAAVGERVAELRAAEEICEHCQEPVSDGCRCEDGPLNPCGFCGIREAAPGLTACNYCA